MLSMYESLVKWRYNNEIVMPSFFSLRMLAPLAGNENTMPNLQSTNIDMIFISLQ